MRFSSWWDEFTDNLNRVLDVIGIVLQVLSVSVAILALVIAAIVLLWEAGILWIVLKIIGAILLLSILIAAVLTAIHRY